MATPEFHLRFLVTAADYARNIRRQKVIAKCIHWSVQLEFPLEEWERDFLAYQRSQPMPTAGHRGPAPKGRELSDAEYAVLRTSRLVEYPTLAGVGKQIKRHGIDGRPREHDHALIALHVASLMIFNKMKKTHAIERAARDFGFRDTKTIRNAWDSSGAGAMAHLLRANSAT